MINSQRYMVLNPKDGGVVAISFDDTRYSINHSTVLDYLVSVFLNTTAPVRNRSDCTVSNELY